MDTEAEVKRAKSVLACGAVFLVSCFLVYDEFAYLVWGREAQATITKAYEVTKGGRFGMGGTKRLEIDFTFVEPGGGLRRGTTTESPDWPIPRSGTFTVQYTPGELGRARPLGRVSWTAIIIFFGALLAVAVFVVIMLRDANEALKPTEPKKKKRKKKKKHPPAGSPPETGTIVPPEQHPETSV